LAIQVKQPDCIAACEPDETERQILQELRILELGYLEKLIQKL
jgi:hypothetical protein